MKLSETAKLFLRGKGDKKIRKFVNKGGRKGALIDFNKILTHTVSSTRS